MTNKERYKQAFSALHSFGQFHMEVEEMAQIQKKHKRNIATAAAVACAIVIGGSGTVYAADIGGIQEKISMWLYATKTEVEVTENEDGGYTFTYERDGKPSQIVGFGGVAIDNNGNETWLSADELASRISESADIEEDEDGKVWLYYFDKKIEITDLFDENGICRVLLSHEGKISYLKVNKNKDGNYSYSQTDDPTGETETYLYIETE